MPAVFTALVTGSAHAQSSSAVRDSVELLDRLATEGLDAWRETRLADRPTRYRIGRENGRSVLEAESFGGNSALWRRVDVPVSRTSVVSWRWKVARSLSTNRRERSRRGDDFAARLFVVFDAPEGPWSGKAVCYVWAGLEPIGAAYRSPYSDDVAMIVVESGDARAGSWVTVRRNVVDDYRAAFGAAPETLSGIAIMVDTDNTESRARAWFEGLVVIRRP